MTACYLFGVVSSELSLPEGAVGMGAPAQRLAHGSIAAVFSEVEESFQPEHADIDRHAHVIERIFDVGTVLPFRFGTVLPDQAAVLALLREREGLYRNHLQRVDGAVELELKVRHRQDRVLMELAQDPWIRRLSAATRANSDVGRRLELGEAVAQALDRRRQEDASWLLGHLAPLSSAAVQHRPGTDVLRAGFLVSRGRVRDFSGGVEELEASSAASLEFDYVGPLPPYSFAEPPELDPVPQWAS